MPSVEYQALYRKYRPQTFAQVVGQSHITDTLVREIAEDKVAHAYLFAGPRGTGKTTSARILAKALNCQNKPGTGEPCDDCPSCRAISDGSSFDVTELDAASHNSVDDIRDIKVSVTTVASVGGAKRVFILDEAHMLSKAAGNALLKTLEEPPEHVHFVLATTEPYKLLDTIRSRSQRFDFHPVSIETLTQHLGRVAESEGYQVDGDALTLVARHAKGSVRDSLSLLEQVAALGAGAVQSTGVTRALGLADRDVYLALADAIANSDARVALEMIANLAAQGVDLRRFISEAIGFFRGVFLAHYAPNLEEIADEPPETLEDWRSVAKFLAAGDVIRTIDLLSEGLLRLREGREERLMTELTMLKVVRPEVASDPASMVSRLESVEQRITRLARDQKDLKAGLESGATGTGSSPAPSQGTADPPAAVPTVEAATTPPQAEAAEEPEEAPSPTPDDAPFESETSSTPAPPTPATPATGPAATPAANPAADGAVSAGDVEAAWPALVAQVRDSLGLRREALLREVRPGRVEGGVIVLYVTRHLGFHLEQLRADGQVASLLAERAGELLGSTVSIRFDPEPEDGGAASDPGDDEPDPDEPIPDKNDLLPADPAGDDAVALVEDLLGGEVIEDD